VECLIDGCEREVKARGLCACCYQVARSMVAAGKTTWEVLETRGLALPSKTMPEGGRFAMAFAASEPVEQPVEPTPDPPWVQ